MAQLRANSQTNILKIREFLGLNENPDGDTHLKNGELGVCRNFRVTRDRHLQLRPGQKTMLDLRAAWERENGDSGNDALPLFYGVWCGKVGGKSRTLAAFGGDVFDLDLAGGAARRVGKCTGDQTSFFGFENRVYLLNGHEYMRWDGGENTAFETVEGYIPTVKTACAPSGLGTGLENVNRLTGKRRVKFSPDGQSTVYHLPEQAIDEVVSVTGGGAYTADTAAGTVTFAAAPAAGINTIAIVYRKGNGKREDVEKMRFSEFYNGTSDARVFLYGDGTNRTVYSGNNADAGRPTAEYFPDLGEARVGDENTAITAMVRHYSRLLVLKEDSAYSMDYATAADAAGKIVPVFYVLPVNRQTGNAAPGQVRLLENDPLSLFGGSVYQWSSAYSGGGITSDSRNAGRISDRVRTTLADFDFSQTVTFSRPGESEFYFLCGERALVFNYGADAWYVYDHFGFRALLDVEGELYGFTRTGEVRHISRQYRSDCGAEIAARAETGAMDFDRDWLLKYSPQVFVAIQPESGARVTVTVETNRRGDYPEKLVTAGLAGFHHVDFGHFSFGTNRKPQVKRVKMKVKKATFYKLVFKSQAASATVTLLETDVQLRYAGNVK